MKCVRPAYIHFEDIPCNQYRKTVKDELGNFTTEQLINIYRDMLTLREFETMINEIKINGKYNGVSYNHPGPAHLSIGEEAAAVGEAFHMDGGRSDFRLPPRAFRHSGQGPFRDRKAVGRRADEDHAGLPGRQDV